MSNRQKLIVQCVLTVLNTGLVGFLIMYPGFRFVAVHSELYYMATNWIYPGVGTALGIWNIYTMHKWKEMNIVVKFLYINLVIINLISFLSGAEALIRAI